MFKNISTYIIGALLATQCAVAQEKERDSTLSGEVNIVSSYNPTVSDAFKIKSNPSLNDSVTLTKKLIKYSIFSVPVASTFTPAKGKASGIQKMPKEKLYNSYVALGLGNYTNALLDFYTSRALSRNETLDIGLQHHSSQGDIDGVTLDNNFFNTKVDGAYFRRERDMEWGANVGFQHQIYNWYGTPEQAYLDEDLAGVDPQQTYYRAYAGATLNFDDSYFKGGDINLQRFWDATGAGETNVVLQPKFEFPISEQLVTTNVEVDYLSGEFNETLYADATIEPFKYANAIFSANPNLKLQKGDVAINLGATVSYLMDMEGDASKLYVYPKVTASYDLVTGYVMAYGGITGGLHQNTFAKFAEENHFIMPNLFVAPSDEQYNGYVGLKGKLMQNLSYNIKGSYSNVNNQAFYVNAMNFVAPTAVDQTKGYAYQNAFDVVYDKLKTISAFGELKLDVSNNFSLGANATFYDFSVSDLQEAYNMPSLEANIFSDFTIGQKWYGGASIFFVGERKDLAYLTTMPELSNTTVTLDSYFDANFHLGYHFTEQLSAFLRLNNIANNDYARWANYRVQGFQVVAGAAYKFDF